MTALRQALTSPAGHSLLPADAQTPGRGLDGPSLRLNAAAAEGTTFVKSLGCPLTDVRVVDPWTHDVAAAEPSECAGGAPGVLVFSGEGPAKAASAPLVGCRLARVTVFPTSAKSAVGRSLELWTTLQLDGRDGSVWLCRNLGTNGTGCEESARTGGHSRAWSVRRCGSPGGTRGACDCLCVVATLRDLRDLCGPETQCRAVPAARMVPLPRPHVAATPEQGVGAGAPYLASTYLLLSAAELADADAVVVLRKRPSASPDASVEHMLVMGTSAMRTVQHVQATAWGTSWLRGEGWRYASPT